jgi:methionine sulfoxide reductase catalytic subunit
MENKLKHLEIPSSEITPENIYLSRRDFLKAGLIVGATTLLSACKGKSVGNSSVLQPQTPLPGWSSIRPTSGPQIPDNAQGQTTDELGSKLNTFEEITTYNNYYEFSESKTYPAVGSQNLVTTGWMVHVGGLVHNPKTYSLDDLVRFSHKDRVYRLRCVEGWSMVIPWSGFELNELLKDVQPMGSAKYVAFTTALDPDHMPMQNFGLYPWPYTEGLRLDEAMNKLTILATGMYGQELPKVDGAPLRLVVPWKYGFKSIKAIYKIDLTEEQPKTFWNTVNGYEYGFYSNVNPYVDHPRWSQASERRIGELGRRATLLFNGYYDEVAQLYTGMDLKVNY